MLRGAFTWHAVSGWRFPQDYPFGGRCSPRRVDAKTAAMPSSTEPLGGPEYTDPLQSSTLSSAGHVADFVAGALGGVALCVVTQPFDTVKVLMQAQPDRFKSAWSCTKSIVHQSVSGGKGMGT